ncbi:helix-turn-helix domain-containing protein [Paenibacillus sp. JX-17]|uniref:Helix-turn-helix domain-containing protein n=1 Tax=Paenibacillus lacisoli TaxID=3064525 RepID=A0ABT9CHZ0_9BACL|nr:helix-turn-helix domain-containing protein [Paenibacillus sp. JX-17]MDO7908900.1 helix-turn-helix domain-containing protein [Paenibacillus sp. JX-17]
MKTRTTDFWLIKSNKAANAYMDEVAKESNFTEQHKGYTIVPQKLHRCYGLSEYEKLIFIDIIAYMSDKSQCYPTMEMLARNIGCSSKTVERHIGILADKKLILVSQSKNNTYYLPNYMHVHPYLLLSEKTHEFIRGVKKQVNERDLTLWIQGIVKSEDFKAYAARLQRLHERRLPMEKFAETETLASNGQYLTTAFAKRFPPDVNGA